MKTGDRGKLVFVLGGSASGKSKFAVQLAKKIGEKIVFVATCSPQDEEMKEKIKKHKKERPSHWQIIEAAATPFRIPWPSRSIDCLLIDSLAMWISTLTMQNMGLRNVKNKLNRFVSQVRSKYKAAIVVSDEVGLGIVPDNPLVRNFRETLGCVHQIAARSADDLFFIVCGLPIHLKKGNIRGGAM